MPNLLIQGSFTAGICAAAAYVCDQGGAALKNKLITKAIACSIATACAGMLNYKAVLLAQESIEKALPSVGTGLKAVGRYLKK